MGGGTWLKTWSAMHTASAPPTASSCTRSQPMRKSVTSRISAATRSGSSYMAR